MLMLAMTRHAVKKVPPLSGHYRNCLLNSTLGGGVGGTPRSTVFSFKSQGQLWPQTCTFKFHLMYSAASLPVSLIHLYVKIGPPCCILFIMQTSKGSKKSAFSNMWTPLNLIFGIQTKAAISGKCLTVNGSIFNVFPKYFGPERRTRFIVRDCQCRQWARQADMTWSAITLEMGLLFFRTFLCMSLRESRLSEKAFPVMNHIFPFAALNASEGLRHKTKWGADDPRQMSLCAQSFIQSKNRSYDLHPAYKAIWPSAYPTLEVMGEHADR